MLWYSLEVPHQGASNKYPQHTFLLRNRKNILWVFPLIWSYTFHSYVYTFTCPSLALVAIFVKVFKSEFLTLLLLIMSCPVLANSIDPDQLASEEAN